MIFTSFDFLLFIGPVLWAYWRFRLRRNARLIWLLGVSYFFYVASPDGGDGAPPPGPSFVGLLVASTLLDYCCGRGMAAADSLPTGGGQLLSGRALRVICLVASLSGNFGLLFYFKYASFLLDVSSDVAQVMGLAWMAPEMSVILPIGISFYTFQSVSYTIDVFRRRINVEYDLLNFAAYISCFPQLVAGPIVRAVDLLPQLPQVPSLSRLETKAAMFRIFKGTLKKVLLGDLIGIHLVDPVFAQPENFSSLEVLIALYAFTLQIYADFSGYSDIAIGVARLLGLQLPENFDRPHRADSVADFWRRWHMTLSTWLRDYLYFPLGGSRGGRLRSYFNLWLTMFLVGLWHGASWNFVVYANLQAVAMVVNRWHRCRKTGTQGPGDTSLPDVHFVVRVAASSMLICCVLSVLLVFAEQIDRTAGTIAVSIVVSAHVIGVWLRTRRGRWNHATRVLLVFHFTVLSRVFFRAEDFESASLLYEKLVIWDGRGVRSGWFSVSSLTEGSPVLAGLGEYFCLLLLVFGLGFEFSPKSWTEGAGRVFSRLPSPVIGLLIAAAAAVSGLLLDGPRPNIYFNF